MKKKTVTAIVRDTGASNQRQKTPSFTCSIEKEMYIGVRLATYGVLDPQYDAEYDVHDHKTALDVIPYIRGDEATGQFTASHYHHGPGGSHLGNVQHVHLLHLEATTEDVVQNKQSWQ